jgi:hypothetical protein
MADSILSEKVRRLKDTSQELQLLESCQTKGKIEHTDGAVGTV